MSETVKITNCAKCKLEMCVDAEGEYQMIIPTPNSVSGEPEETGDVQPTPSNESDSASSSDESESSSSSDESDSSSSKEESVASRDKEKTTGTFFLKWKLSNQKYLFWGTF